MIYAYTLHGKVHNSDRKISYYASIPLGISNEDLWERVANFAKAFKFLKLEVN